MADSRRVKRGDTKRRRWQLSDVNGVIDLTNADEVEMYVALAPTSEGTTATPPATVALNGTCDIEAPPTAGIVLEPVGGTGSLVAALYRAEFQITWNDGTTETVPDEGWELIEVLEDLGS